SYALHRPSRAGVKRNSRPALDRRLQRLIQARPESRQDTLVELLGEQKGQIVVRIERLSLKECARDRRVLQDDLDRRAKEELFFLRSLRPAGDQIIQAQPQRHVARHLADLTIGSDLLVHILSGAVAGDALLV